MTFFSFGCSETKLSHKNEATITTWRGSRANGDKPGVGFELIRTSKGYEADFKGAF